MHIPHSINIEQKSPRVNILSGYILFTKESEGLVFLIEERNDKCEIFAFIMPFNKLQSGVSPD